MHGGGWPFVPGGPYGTGALPRKRGGRLHRADQPLPGRDFPGSHPARGHALRRGAGPDDLYGGDLRGGHRDGHCPGLGGHPPPHLSAADGPDAHCGGRCHGGLHPPVHEALPGELKGGALCRVCPTICFCSSYCCPSRTGSGKCGGTGSK